MIYPNRFDSLCLSLVIAAASVPVAAQSVQPPLRGPMTFEVFDMDGDGQVEPEEFAAHQAELRAQMMQQMPQQ
jgi:hypothetical protein